MMTATGIRATVAAEVHTDTLSMAGGSAARSVVRAGGVSCMGAAKRLRHQFACAGVLRGRSVPVLTMPKQLSRRRQCASH
ncbi:hypothetical protein SUDANB38_05904 (plasmid) [Streptomyces sp. enrichment culture]